MTATFELERAAWQRENALHHYVGTLEASADGIQLRGCDPVSGIRVSLRIPVEEVSRVRVSQEWDERLAGERCAVVELRDSVPVCVRAVGADAVSAEAVSAALAAVVQGRLAAA